MLLTRVFGSSVDPERRFKALTVTALTGAIGVLLLLALFLYLAFSEVVDNKARLAALENTTTLASSTASLTERLDSVSSNVAALNGRSAVLDQKIANVEGQATSAALENSTGLASLSTTVTDQSNQINRVSGELDSLITTAKVLETQVRAADSQARSAAVDASTAVLTLSTSLTGLTEQAVLVSHDVDSLKFDSTTLEDRLRDLQRELDVLSSDFRDLRQRFDQRR